MIECNKSVYLANKSIDMIDAVNKGYTDGYNNAIDDFERIMCEELKDYIDNKDYMCVGLSLHKFTRDLAEQLKAGERMNKAFENILERLQEHAKMYQESIERQHSIDYRWIEEEGLQATEEAIDIINQVEAEYNNGWIPCSERLPDDDDICIVTVEYPNNETVVQYGWFDKKGVCWYVGMQEFRTSNVLAWMPLPQPYKESE